MTRQTCAYGLPCTNPEHSVLNALLVKYFNMKDKSSDEAHGVYVKIENEKSRLKEAE